MTRTSAQLWSAGVAVGSFTHRATMPAVQCVRSTKKILDRWDDLLGQQWFPDSSVGLTSLGRILKLDIFFFEVNPKFLVWGGA